MSEQASDRNQLSLLAIAVTLVSAHSIVLGIVLLAAPKWLLSLFGWSIDCHRFFLQQAGLFHVLLGTFYAVEFSRYRHVRVLVITKVSAVLFLTLQYACSVREVGVLVSNGIDAAMAVVVGALWWRTSRPRTGV
ncbi:MAG: hypothetical protein AB1644_04825 [Candidatus Zixiibacteriota bacterium]